MSTFLHGRYIDERTYGAKTLRISDQSDGKVSFYQVDFATFHSRKVHVLVLPVSILELSLFIIDARTNPHIEIFAVTQISYTLIRLLQAYSSITVPESQLKKESSLPRFDGGFFIASGSGCVIEATR